MSSSIDLSLFGITGQGEGLHDCIAVQQGICKEKAENFTCPTVTELDRLPDRFNSYFHDNGFNP
jgi:hypothetical protein